MSLTLTPVTIKPDVAGIFMSTGALVVPTVCEANLIGLNLGSLGGLGAFASLSALPEKVGHTIVGAGLGVAVGDNEGASIGVGRAVGVAVGVAVRVPVAVGVAVAVGVGVGVRVAVAVANGVAVGVEGPGVGVGVGEVCGWKASPRGPFNPVFEPLRVAIGVASPELPCANSRMLFAEVET